MLKIAAAILDQFDATPEELFKTAEDMPEFVRDAVVPDAREQQLISDFDYAIVYYNLKSEKLRKYLLVDPGNIWLSAKFFSESRENWPKTAQGIIVRSILSRAEKNGISGYPIFDKLKEIKTSLQSDNTWRKLPEKNVYDENLYKIEETKAKVLKDQQNRNGGPTTIAMGKVASSKVWALKPGDDYWVDRNMYDISTPELVKNACVYFEENKHIMPLKSKRKYARAVCDQASNLNVKVSPSVSLYGGLEVNVKLAHENMIRRAKLCTEDLKKTAADIMLLIPKMSADELIACVEAFDKKAFSGREGRFNLPDPVLSVTDANSEDKVLYDGAKQFTLRDLKAVVKNKTTKLSEVFDQKVIDSLKSNPEKAFKALPAPHKKVIAGLSD